MPAKGSSTFGPDVIVGSPEYWKLWRAKNKDRQKLAQAKYRFKQKQTILAAKLAVEDGIPIEQALAEITAKTDAIVTLRSEMVNEGRISHHAAPPLEVNVEADLPPIAEMVDEAEKTGQTYAQVKEAYQAAARWKLVETKTQEVDPELLRLAASKGLTPLRVGDMATEEVEDE